MTSDERYDILIRAAELIETDRARQSCGAIYSACKVLPDSDMRDLILEYCNFYGQYYGHFWLNNDCKDFEIRDEYLDSDRKELRVMLLLWFAEVTCD